MFGSKYVKLLAGALVAGVALTACDNPVRMGAAATLGDQRISDATLDQAVRDWYSAIHRDPLSQQQMQLSDQSSIPRSVLTWLINFRLVDEAAREHGISVVQGQLDGYRAALQAQQTQQGGPPLTVTAVEHGIPPTYLNQLIRSFYLQDALIKTVAPNAQSSQDVQVALAQVTNQAAARLNIRVSPRYGTFDAQQLKLAPPQTFLSRPESGTPSA